MTTVPLSDRADKPAKNRSGYHGVRWDARAKKWAAYVHTPIRQFHHLGLFTDVVEAARVRDARALELCGPRIALNFPTPELLCYLFQDDGSALLPLTQGAYAIIDADDVDRVLPYRWSLFGSKGKQYGLANTSSADGALRPTFLHRFLLSITSDVEVDHIDGNGLNCRRGNLREATRHQNGANRRMNSNNTSGYKGVSYVREGGKWWASIMHNGKTINLGYHVVIEDAARAYDRAARELFGEFARTNFAE